MSGMVSAPSTPDVERRPAPIRAHVLSLLVRPTVPPLAVGLGVAASLLPAETLLGLLLRRVAPEGTLGVVYLLGVVVLAIGWGWRSRVTPEVEPRCSWRSRSTSGVPSREGGCGTTYSA